MTATPALRFGALCEDEFKQLASVTGPCVTIVQPLAKDPAHLDASTRAVRSAVSSADRLMKERLCGDSAREGLLQPIRLLTESTEWNRLNGSLVVLCAPAVSVITVWPELLAPRIHYGDEFFLLPFLPWTQTEHDFWLLGLSEKTVHLFRGSAEGMVEAQLPSNVPRSLADAEQMDTPDRMLQGRSSIGKSAGELRKAPFSTATTKEKEPRWMHDFFKAVDRGIRPLLQGSGLPLILAAVTRELAAYREVNSYDGILTGSIHGNPDAVGRDFLHTRAIALMRARVEAQRSRAIAERDDAAGTPRFLSSSDSILNAARAGKIEKLYIPNPLPLQNQQSPMLNRALVDTWRHSGGVVLFAANGLEDGVGALLRMGHAA
jgi:hypothetical protein